MSWLLLLQTARRSFTWLLQHPSQAALIAAALWLCWLHLVTLPGKDAAIAERDRAVAQRTGERDQERAAHRSTKQIYATAQAEARELEEKRLARVAAEQQEITDDVVEDYRRRLADARASAERLRQNLPARAGADGAPDHLDLSDAGGAAGGAAAAAEDPRFPLEQRLIATEQAIQLDALITWVTAQAAVRPNE